MRRPGLLLALAATLGLVLAGGFALAGRPSSSYALQLFSTGGEPQSLGVLVSAAGASITNATTAAPFTISATTLPLRTLVVQCDATAFVGFGATCGTTLAASSGCVRLGTTSPKGDGTFVIDDTTTAINAAGPAAFNCTVSKVR